MMVIAVLVIVLQFVAFNLTTITICLYIAFFGMFLCCTEFKIPNIEVRLRREFGFLYSFVGRTLFILFAGTMCLSLAVTLGYILGIATIANALFNAYVVKTHPSFKSGELKRSGDPAASYTSGADEATAYIKAHPELEARATSAIVGGALAAARASKQQPQQQQSRAFPGSA